MAYDPKYYQQQQPYAPQNQQQYAPAGYTPHVRYHHASSLSSATLLTSHARVTVN